MAIGGVYLCHAGVYAGPLRRFGTSSAPDSVSLRDALFERGRPIGEEEVLAELASALDLVLPDEQEARTLVEAEWAEGRERGVEGSPHFFVDDGSWFCPALRIEQAEGRLHIDVDTTRRDAFFAAAFPT